MLAAAFSLKKEHGRWWLALGGIASIIFGIVLIIAPVVGAVVLTWWLGAYALIFGVLLLVLAFQLHGKQEEQQKKKKSATAAKPASVAKPATAVKRAAAKKG
jgi:peptidoglycan/LPS O-acetylase OafA/YrhL